MGRYFFNTKHQFCWRTVLSCVLQRDLWAVSVLLICLRSNSQRTASLRLCREPPEPYRTSTHSYRTDRRLVCRHIQFQKSFPNIVWFYGSFSGKWIWGCIGQIWVSMKLSRTCLADIWPQNQFYCKLNKIKPFLKKRTVVSTFTFNFNYSNTKKIYYFITFEGIYTLW